MKPPYLSNLSKIAIYSLSFLWIFTGLASAFFSPQVGYQVLANANITGYLADFCVYAGALLDIVIGVWLLSAYQRMLCCIVQIATILIYTVLLSFIDASFWLHPFAPIVKNFPIIVLILYVYFDAED